ncbi:MAG: MoaD/ThiS family protein [Thermomicrobiales bacterium]
MPRILAGERAEASGATLGALAADLAARCPALRGPVLDLASGWPLKGYVFFVDGRVSRDPACPVFPGAAVLLVASAAGG